MHPHVSSQYAKARQRDLLAKAERQRQARQFMAQARESRRAERTQRRMRQAVRRALRLSSGLEQ
jgi:hypothetical protein